jgi:hypothetical protein
MYPGELSLLHPEVIALARGPGAELPTGELPTIHVSADNGHTWQTSPSAGLPTDQRSWTPAPLGVLHDGTLVFNDLTFYGWKPGASSWTQLTPVIRGPLDLVRDGWLDQPTDAHPAGIWTLVHAGGEAELEYCRLTA